MGTCSGGTCGVLSAFGDDEMKILVTILSIYACVVSTVAIVWRIWIEVREHRAYEKTRKQRIDRTMMRLGGEEVFTK